MLLYEVQISAIFSNSVFGSVGILYICEISKRRDNVVLLLWEDEPANMAIKP